MTTELNATIDAAPGVEIVPGSGIWIRQVPIELLRKATWNPRSIKKAARKALDGILGEFGLVDVLQWNRRTGELIGGHQRLDWLERQGAKVVAVAVLDLDETRAKALNVSLNNPKAQGVFAEDDLPALLAQVNGAMPQMYGAIGLSALLSQAEVDAHTRTTITVDTDKDDPEIETEPRVAPGDLWDLGGSRLICGDSFVDDDVRAAIGELKIFMVCTDPLYAIYGSSTGVASDIADDKMVRPFFEAMWKVQHRVLPKFGHALVSCDWRSWASLWEAAKRAEMSPKNMIVWDKGGSGLGSNYANTHELIAFFMKLPKQATMRQQDETGIRPVHRPNMMRFPRPSGDEREHNAAKPVPMLKELIENSCTGADDAVLDMFGGSGSTLIAATAVGRRCAMLELEPKRCDVIVARYERVTGDKARKLSR